MFRLSLFAHLQREIETPSFQWEQAWEEVGILWASLNHTPAVFQCLLLLAWLPTGMTHQDLPSWGKPRNHRTVRCYSAEELSHGQVPPHLLTRNARWEQALPVALVASLEATGHKRQHEGLLAGTQCPVLRPEEVLEADTHKRSISPWRYR